MNSETPLIRYSYRSFQSTETITVYKERITVEYNKKISRPSEDITFRNPVQIEVRDADFIKNIILTSTYAQFKEPMKKTYDQVNSLDPKTLTRPKNSAQQVLSLNVDEDFSATVDMFVKEYGTIFTKFVGYLRNIIKIRIDSKK
ncbi:MAG: hypothetical protein MJ154_00500 [Candidatus Saccharibacteria bacterium]|nr:hypothetical protein [Candidatus Saccharibacteria bacterium]